MRKYGLKGAAIGGSVLGNDFSDAKYHPVWAKAEDLGVTLFIHPQSTPQLASRFRATAGCQMSSAIRSIPPSRCNT